MILFWPREEIVADEQVDVLDAVYVGDSLSKDMRMANLAGVLAAGAWYGTEYDRASWDLLLRVTHWDGGATAAAPTEVRGTPDIELESFDQLLQLFHTRNGPIVGRQLIGAWPPSDCCPLLRLDGDG